MNGQKEEIVLVEIGGEQREMAFIIWGWGQ